MPEPHEDDEHVNYIRELIDNIIFTKDLDPAALAEKTSSPVEAIDLALGFEKDSVIFYIQFKSSYRKKSSLPYRVWSTKKTTTLTGFWC